MCKCQNATVWLYVLNPLLIFEQCCHEMFKPRTERRKKRTERKDGKISKGEIKGRTVADMGGKEHRHPHEQT